MKCSSCGAEIVWTVSPAGARLPVDARPLPSAIVAEPFLVLYCIDPALVGEGGSAQAFHRQDYAAAFEREIPLHPSHFATCPDRDRFKKRRR